MPLVMGGIWLEVEETTWWGWRCEFAMVDERDGTLKRVRSGRLAVSRARSIVNKFLNFFVVGFCKKACNGYCRNYLLS